MPLKYVRKTRQRWHRHPNWWIHHGTGTPTVIPPTFRYVLEVDWDNNGSFSNALSDVTSLCLSVDCTRGRNYSSQLTGRSQAGTMTVVLNNMSELFSSLNTSSPIYGKNLPGRKIRLRTANPDHVLWAGYLNSIVPKTVVGPWATATLNALGPFMYLSGNNAVVSPVIIQPEDFGTSTTSMHFTGDAINNLLDSVPWTGGRTVARGDILLSDWWVEAGDCLQKMQEVEDTELGFLYEGLNWDIIFENRYFRDQFSKVSQATYSDVTSDPFHYTVIDQDDPLREVFNDFTGTVNPFYIGTYGSLWQLSPLPMTLNAGESTILSMTASAVRDSNANLAYVREWATVSFTVTGADPTKITLNYLSQSATKQSVKVTNTDTVPATFTDLQAYGYPAYKSNQQTFEEQDGPSQVTYLKRNYPLSSPWWFNNATAVNSADYLLSYAKDVRPIMTLTFPTSKNPALLIEMATRALSDRVTLKGAGNAKLGVNSDFYVESVSHSLRPGPWHTTALTLAPVKPNAGQFFILDSSTLDGSDLIAY